MMRTATVVAMLLAGVTQPVLAMKIYKYTDTDGNVAYADNKPANVTAQEMRPSVQQISPEAARKELDDLTQRARSAGQNRELVASSAEASEAEAQRRRDNCAQALKNLDILHTSPRVQTADAQGNLFYLDDTAKQAKTAETQAQVDEYCQ